MADTVAAADKDPREGTPIHRLVRGFTYPLQAVQYMFRHPRLWTYALMPILISVVLLGVLFGVLVEYNGDLVDYIWTQPEPWWQQALWYLLYTLVFLVTFVVGAVSFPGLVASPFNDALSERTERLAVGEVEEQKLTAGKLLRDVGRAVRDELVKLSLLLGGHLLLLVLLLIPVAGQISYAILATSWTIIWLSGEYLQYPMARAGFSIGKVMKLVRTNLSLSFGFGGAIFLILMVPLLNFLFVPVAVVAGTLLYSSLKKVGGLPARA